MGLAISGTVGRKLVSDQCLVNIGKEESGRRRGSPEEGISLSAATLQAEQK